MTMRRRKKKSQKRGKRVLNRFFGKLEKELHVEIVKDYKFRLSIIIPYL